MENFRLSAKSCIAKAGKEAFGDPTVRCSVAETLAGLEHRSYSCLRPQGRCGIPAQQDSCMPPLVPPPLWPVKSGGPAEQETFQGCWAPGLGSCTPRFWESACRLKGLQGSVEPACGAWQWHPHGEIGRLVKAPLTTRVPPDWASPARQDQGCVTARWLYMA